MKKYQLKIGVNDKNLMVPAVKIGNLLGYDDDVSTLVSDETNSSINKEVDGEVRRILPLTTKQIQFRFWNGASYVTFVAPTEFPSPFTDFNTNAAKKSFYIIQLFDTFKDEVQSKKHTGYLNGYDFAKSNLTSIYTFSSDMEFSNLYVPQSVLDGMSGVTTDFYIKFLFYSAKSGTFYSFFNNNISSTTQEKLYHKISINPNTLRYSFSPDVAIIELNELLNANYKSFINNTVDSIPVEKPNFPAGNTFTNDGEYISV
jgi:hypothetical protein